MNGKNYNQDQKLLFETQRRHEENIDRLYGKVNNLAVDLAVLKVKAAIWGGGAGIVFGAVATLLGELMLRRMHP